MISQRFLLDTFFIQALLNERDTYHKQAVDFLPKVQRAAEVWITEAVIVEVGNALSSFDRVLASRFIRQCYSTPNIRVVTADTGLLMQALEIYEARDDKTWGLTDCISFVVMEQQGLTDAVTADRHFMQAGYHAVLADKA